MKEMEVNAFTGHSNNSHTSLNYYYHLDKNWAGKMLVERKVQSMDLIQVVQEVQEPFDRDEEDRIKEDLNQGYKEDLEE
jgi:hypothetical protein